MDVRVCVDCGQEKPLEAFTQNRGTPWYHRRCKPCRARRLWERAHPGENYDSRPSFVWPTKGVPTPKPPVRTCSDCGTTKPHSEFVPIKESLDGRYGRCRDCRARRAKEKYWADPLEREKQKARVRRNAVLRRANVDGSGV